MRPMIGALAALAIAGCGRIDFDPRADAPAQPHLFAYVIDGYSAATTKTALRVFDVDGAGTFTEAAGSPADVGAQPEFVVADAAGTHLYVVSSTGGTISTFSIDRDTGALRMLDVDAAGVKPEMAIEHPNGRWLYVPDFGNQPLVYGFAIAADATLTSLPGSPYAVAGASSADWVEIHPAGRWLYVVDDGTAYVYPMEVAADGSLSAATARWSTMDSLPHALLLDSTGIHGYVAPDLAGGIPSCTLDPATGALSTTPGSKFGSEANTSLNEAMDRTRTRLFVANDGAGMNTVSAFAIDPGSGALSDLAGAPAATPNGNSIWSVATSPISDDVYTTTTMTNPAIVHYRASATSLERIETFDFPGLDHTSRLTLVQVP